MKLYHTTLKRNLDSIRKHGLTPSFAQKQTNPRVWLHTKSRRLWGILHVQKRHKVPMSEILIIEVNVPRSQLKRRWRGIWTTTETLTEFQSITDAVDLAASPIPEEVNT